VAAHRWTDLPRRFGEGLVRDLRGLRGNERLAVAAVGLIVISLPLPWYSVSGSDLVRTGLGSFSFAEGAILLTGAAVVFLALQVGGGYVPPRPLTEWGLFVVAGIWIALIVAYRMLDRPELNLDLPLARIETHYGLGYGIFVALAGAVLLVIVGIRTRAKRRRSS
jgi:hypothetical protein